MLNNKKCRPPRGLWWVFVVLGGILISGCTPPGPRALLDGRRLMEQGRIAEAIPHLQRAAELLPTNVVAWSSLGVAYHQNGQYEAALGAYQKALKIDDRLGALRFNLGCLYLDLNNLGAAIDELRTFTLLQSSSVDGWLKLATAQYRARRLDDAEKSFRSALGLQTRHPEALNGQGLIQVQRRRWPEALTLFNAAAAAGSNYPPAILNCAVVQHQYLNNRAAALAHYRRYVELNPRGAEQIRPIIAQLERELNPGLPATTSTQTTVVTRTPVAPNGPGPATPTAPAATGKSNSIASAFIPVDRSAADGKSRPTVTVTNPPANAAANNPATTGTGRHPIRTGEAATIPSVRTSVVARASEAPRNLPATNNSNSAPTSAVSTGSPATNARPPEVPPLEVARVRDDFVVKAPTETATPAVVGSPATGAPAGSDSTTRSAASTPPPPRKGLFSRLNPFNRSTRGTNEGETSVAARAPNSPGAPRELTRPDGLPELAPPNIARYAYISPRTPADGNRSVAEQAFRRGVRLQKSSERAKAAAEYQSALRSDPGYFDAYYNLGLVALDSGDARLSLWAYEFALAVQPDSADARYNLSLALKAGGYPLDAADQLQILLQQEGGDARAHLSLANLFAQQLKQPRKARDHYMRVLEINPRHPDAPAIRYWIAANP